MSKLKNKNSRKDMKKPTTCKEPTQCPHEHFRCDVPDRRGLAKDKHINILATPKGYRWEDVKRDDDGEPAKKTPIHRRSCPDKYAKKPEKSYVHNFLAEVWSFLTPEMADRLKNMLMNEFSMSSKDAEEFIFKQREANVMNSSTVSMYKKPRDIGDGKVVYDSVIKLRTPNKTYCDKFPKSNIGIRNSWIKDFSDLISDKMADYVLDTMTAERTERQQEIAQNLLNRFNTLLEQKASLANPKTQTHKTMVLVADRLSLWLDKNVPMSKETAQRMKDIEEAQERKKLEEERQKDKKEERKPTAEGPKSEEENEEGGEGDQGPGGPPGAGGAEPGAPGAESGETEAEPGAPTAKPGAPGAEPQEPGSEPGAPGAEPQEPGSEPGAPGAEPGAPEAETGASGAEPDAPGAEPGAKPGEAGAEPVAKPDERESETTEPGAQPSEAGAQPEKPAAEPGEQGAEPVEPGAPPDESRAQPGESGAQPEDAVDTQPGEARAPPGEDQSKQDEGVAQPGTAEAEPTEPETQPEKPGQTDVDVTKPVTLEEQPAGSEETRPEDGKPTSPEDEPGKGEEDNVKDELTDQPEKPDNAKPEQADGTQPEKADEPQPGTAEVVDEQKSREDMEQTSPVPPAEEAKPLDQQAEKGEEQSSDVPPSSDAQPENVETTQPDEGKSLDEPKGDEDKPVEPAAGQPEPPPSDDEIQPTPSEVQQKALEEPKGEENVQDKPQDTASPGDADQKTAAENEPPLVPAETPESAPLQTAGSEDKVAPTEPEATLKMGDETAPDDEKFYEPSDEPTGQEGEPAGEKADEQAIPVEKEPTSEPTTNAGEEPATKPGEKPTTERGEKPGAKELTPEEQRQLGVIQAVTSKIVETPAEDTPRQEAIKDVLEKQLEKELGDGDKSAIDNVASRVSTWIDKIVEQVENEYGDRGRRSPSGAPSEPGRGPPVSQKPKGSIFVVKKVDDRGFDVDLISNTRAQEKIRMARGKSPARAEVPNPDSALEPADLKDWAQWASAVSDMAQSWAEWIEDTVQEARKRGEILQTDDSPERLKEWDEFRGTKAQGAQQWRKAKREVDQTANLWSKKGMKARELGKPPTE